VQEAAFPASCPYLQSTEYTEGENNVALQKYMQSKLLGKSAVFIVVLIMGAGIMGAQSSDRGFTAYEEARASTSDSGQFVAVDTNIGFDFNQHFGMDIGVPVYFIRPTLAGQTHVWDNRLGDPYWDARYTVENRFLNYATVFTTSVPAEQIGAFSTGHLGLDWFNHFDHPIYRFRPFVNAGIANGIINTHQLSQPFRLTEILKTSGFIGILEGGMDYKLWRKLKIGSSFYAIEPAGTQKISGQPILNTTLTPLAILADHDRGYSAWVRLLSTHYVYTQVGYNHSIKLDEDAATVTVGFDFTPLLRKGMH
jgi:outer membrane protein W